MHSALKIHRIPYGQNFSYKLFLKWIPIFWRIWSPIDILEYQQPPNLILPQYGSLGSHNVSLRSYHSLTSIDHREIWFKIFFPFKGGGQTPIIIHRGTLDPPLVLSRNVKIGPRILYIGFWPFAILRPERLVSTIFCKTGYGNINGGLLWWY